MEQKKKENLMFTVFNTPGEKNTDKTISIANKNAENLGTKTIIVASTTGTTIKAAIKIFDPEKYNLICVTHNYYFREGIPNTFSEELRRDLEKQGVHFISGTLAFSGVGSALMRKFQYFDGSALFSKLIKSVICQGVKVGIEMALMGVDGGFITPGEEILTISGTGRGADTCCWIKAASSRFFENCRVQAIFAKPI